MTTAASSNSKLVDSNKQIGLENRNQKQKTDREGTNRQGERKYGNYNQNKKYQED